MRNLLQKTVKVALALAMLAAPYGTNAGINDIFKGWAWTPFAGWISMNSTNCSLATCGSVASNSYGVTVDDSGNLTGWAWSSNLGWVCFGSTCPGNAPGGVASWALIDPDANNNTPQLYGWARIYSLYLVNPSGSDGWISLNCQTYGSHPARNVCTGGSNPSNYYVSTTRTGANVGQLTGYAWNCAGVASPCTPANYASGVGWIRFDPVYASTLPGTYSSVPWIQVLYGDLYAKGSITTPSPFTTTFKQVNATYCIDKGVGSTVTRFNTDPTKCASGSITVNINLPKVGSNYSNILGRIKLRGYNAALQPVSTAQLAAGKYGPWQQISNQAGLNALPTTLGGAVYDTTGSATTAWTIASAGAITLQNAASGGNGSGLLIIRGNLNIKNNILYQIGTIAKLKQLASFGILVLDDGTGTKGNITIDPGVSTVSANIYAEGVVSTGSTGDPTTEKPLVINGVAVAKQFNFQRQYQGTIANPSSGPSEQIVNDGRIVVNTPPGMNDFVASLPSVSY